jgi:hypothetical protein
LRRRGATLVAAAALAGLAACAGGGEGASDEVVWQDATQEPGPLELRPQIVSPRPGMAEVRPYGFEAAAPAADGRSLRITFWGGVEPCFVLDRVDVDEAPDAVTVTLYAGSDPGARDVACIEIAKYMAVDVPLAAPLGTRRVRDGAEPQKGGRS